MTKYVPVCRLCGIVTVRLYCNGKDVYNCSNCGTISSECVKLVKK